jgi:hypothetical protein
LLFEHYVSLDFIPWLYNGYFQKLLIDIKSQVKNIHNISRKVGGFKNSTYIYVDLKYYESLKTSVNFGSVELFKLRNGNFKDFLLFLMCIIYVGSGSSHRKLSHCALTQALNHNRNKNPQKVHKRILKTWLRGSDIGILEFCTHSTVEETKLFEGFLILFLTNYNYNVSNERQGSLYYHWKYQQKLVSINIGFLLVFKIYQNFINDVCTPIKLSDVLYKPRKMKTKQSKLVKKH